MQIPSVMRFAYENRKDSFAGGKFCNLGASGGNAEKRRTAQRELNHRMHPPTCPLDGGSLARRIEASARNSNRSAA